MSEILQDDVFARLQTLPNVIITGHQAFFTEGSTRQYRWNNNEKYFRLRGRREAREVRSGRARKR